LAPRSKTLGQDCGKEEHPPPVPERIHLLSKIS